MNTNATFGQRNVKLGLVLMTFGFIGGLLISLYAFDPILPQVPAALDEYDDLPRRLLRLAHISAIMLPLLNVVFGLVLDRLELPRRAKLLSSWLLILGAALSPALLALQGAIPSLAPFHLPAAPITAFCLGVFILSAGALRTRSAQLLPTRA